MGMDESLNSLLSAAVEFENGLRDLGLDVSDEVVAERYDTVRSMVAAAIAESDELDPVRLQAEFAIALTRSLVGSINDASRYEVVAGKVCLRKLPSAAMHEVSNDLGSYWVCDHTPSHVEK